MKRVLLLIAVATALSVAGCADWFEGKEVSEQLQRGVSGEGQLGPVNRTADDQAAQHSVPQSHP
jgi:hypothetical protein